MKKSVVFRLGSLGDVILATGPLFYWHRRHGMRFTVITRDMFAPVFFGHPAVETVVGLTADELLSANIFHTFMRLRREYAGMRLLDLHATLRSRLLAGMWKGEVARYPKKSLQRRLFLAMRLFGEALLSLNVPQRYALALESTPPAREEVAPKIWLSEEEQSLADTLLGRSERVIALHPFATHALKSWPHDYWRELARLCLAEGYAPVLIGRTGSRVPDFPGLNLINRTSLRELAAVLSRSRALVTGDSGPMHLGAAVGTPVIALFGPTTAHWGFYPAGEHNAVFERPFSCRPCSLHGDADCPHKQRCLRTVAPEQVFRAIVAHAGNI